MTNKNLYKYALTHWADHEISVTNASKSGSGVPLVESEHVLYHFDAICASMFEGQDSSTSADGLQVEARKIDFVEFKSGFKQKVTKEKFDPAQGACPKTKEVCSDYWDLFWENQDRKIKELISSIRIKAIESYILLEKHFFPMCESLEGSANAKVNFVVVVDEDGVEGIEDTLAELAGTEPDTGNHLISIRQSLKRLVNRQDTAGLPYFYDKIEVLSASDYAALLSRR